MSFFTASPPVHHMMMMMMIRFSTATTARRASPCCNGRGITMLNFRQQLGVVQTKFLHGSSRLPTIQQRQCVQQQRGLASSGRPPMPRVLPPSTLPPPPPPSSSSAAASSPPLPFKVQASTAGTGHIRESVPGFYARTKDRTPVSWTSLFVVGVAAASAVAYYRIERERRLERAMGKVVSSESHGWTPRPDFLAKRKFVPTKWGWFPVEDGFGAPGKPAIGGPWSLIDLDGNLVTEKSFHGKWLLLYFGFARCPDICPSEMNKVAKVLDMLQRDNPELRNKIAPVFVTVDPARDSIQALRQYAKDFHPSYIFLTGSPLQVQQMAKKYRVYVSKANEETDDGDYLVDHSIVIYFHDDTGDLADCFTQSMRPKDIVEKVKERMTFVPSY